MKYPNDRADLPLLQFMAAIRQYGVKKTDAQENEVVYELSIDPEILREVTIISKMKGMQLIMCSGETNATYVYITDHVNLEDMAFDDRTGILKPKPQ